MRGLFAARHSSVLMAGLHFEKGYGFANDEWGAFNRPITVSGPRSNPQVFGRDYFSLEHNL
jgi:hypothetical protein